MSRRASPIGYGMYFIDVLACLLFCLVLTLVGARFTGETTVPVELPELAAGAGVTGDVVAVELTLREEAGRTRYYLEDEALSLDELAARLRAGAPPVLRIRAEETPLARAIGTAHASGVRDIELAYETRRPTAVGPEGGGR